MIENAKTEAVLTITDLHKSFGDNHVLNGITTKIMAGEQVAVIGPSGSGKSTMMNIIDCMDKPSLGEVILDGVFAFMNEVEVYGREYDPNVKPPVEPEGKLGDVNNDGKIDQYDYVLVKRHHFNTRPLTDDEATRADANKDGKVDQYDYLLIARHYFGTYVIK